MLYIMRYGKTDWNVQHKLQGRIDIPNNEKYMKNVQNTYVNYSYMLQYNNKMC